MKRIAYMIIAGLLVMTSCHKEQASQKVNEGAQELVETSQNEELNVIQNQLILNLLESSIKKKDKTNALSYYEEVIGILFQEHDYDRILSYSDQLLSIAPDFIRAFEIKQYAFWKKGQFDDALDMGAIIDKLTEKTNDWQKKHTNFFFTGMIAYDAKDYEHALNLLGAAIKNDSVVKEYGYLAYCYLSATYTKLNDKRMADAFKEAAVKKNNEAEDYIKSIIDNE